MEEEARVFNVFFAFARPRNYSGSGRKEMTNATSIPPTLESLRQRIDALDDALQDLLIERAGIVEEVSRLKRSDNLPPFRPGREAQILRRLAMRHRGRFPMPALVRMWREMLGGTTAMQGELSVALSGGCGGLARDHFGSQAPIVELDSADEVILSVRDRHASLGVLPLREADDSDPWWLALGDLGRERPNVVARLPFGACGNAALDQDALVIALMQPEASGDDCTLYAIEARAPLGLGRVTDAFLKMRLEFAPVAQLREGGNALLAEVGALLAADDARVRSGLETLGTGMRVTWLGAYARPLPDAALDGSTSE
jgi:chorismate mutase